VGLAEAITQQHGPNGPNTHNWGQNSIDAIFLPMDIIKSVNYGYLAFGEGIPSNHHVVWINIPLAALGWFQTLELVPIRARRLKCTDPHIIIRYNKVLQEKINLHNLTQWIETLTSQTRVNHHLTQKQQWEYEAIDTQSTAAKLYMEAKCHKLTVGQIPWCPRITTEIVRILYWKGLKKQILGGHIGAQHLQHLAKQGGIQHGTETLQLEDKQISTKVSQAYKLYQCLKRRQGEEKCG